MTPSSLRFRRKQEFIEIRKPDGHPETDPTIKQSYGEFSGLHSKSLNENIEIHSYLSSAKGKLKVHDNHDSAKHNINKIETNPTNKFRNKCHINVEPSSRRKSSNHDDLALRLSPPGTIKKDEPHERGDSSSQSQHESNHGSAPASELEHVPKLILMGCLNCYLYVMVSDADPKCPKCCNGNRLLDMFRVKPKKKERTEIPLKKARTI